MDESTRENTEAAHRHVEAVRARLESRGIELMDSVASGLFAEERQRLTISDLRDEIATLRHELSVAKKQIASQRDAVAIASLIEAEYSDVWHECLCGNGECGNLRIIGSPYCATCDLVDREGPNALHSEV